MRVIARGRTVVPWILGTCLILAGCEAEMEERIETADSLLSTLQEGWNPIVPGGETICSDGSEYRFFVRPADPARLVVYFQGGGACWTGTTCDPQGEPTYKVTADPELRSASGSEPEEGTLHGILAFARPDNPFRDYSVVFVPYCTGDVHIGDRVATYTVPASEETPEREITVHHRGYTNASAVLDWTFEHFRSPETIFVTGSSAGAIPSPLYARLLADHYAEARVVQLGDGAGGYRNLGETRPHAEWGTLTALSHLPDFAAMTEEEFSFEGLYVTSGRAHPQAMFARYDTAEDEVQVRFLQLGGNDVASLKPLLEANEADIDAAISNYRSYVAPGELHTILLRPELYSYAVGSMGVRDWVADLAGGETVDDVHCGMCTQPPAPAPAPPAATGGGGAE